MSCARTARDDCIEFVEDLLACCQSSMAVIAMQPCEGVHWRGKKGLYFPNLGRCLRPHWVAVCVPINSLLRKNSRGHALLVERLELCCGHVGRVDGVTLMRKGIVAVRVRPLEHAAALHHLLERLHTSGA